MDNSSQETTSPLGSIPSHWRLARLREITSKIGSGATPLGGEKVYLSSRKSCALIRSQCVWDRRFDVDKLAFISDLHAEELRNVEVRPDDLLLNITGDGVTFARCCIVPSSILPARVNQHVAIIRLNRELAAAGYVLSYLVHPTIKNYIESFNAGGSRRAITKGHIENFVVPLPPVEEQRAIAAVLGALDDKIELNRRMNETLERQARAIFRDWFVDFGPPRAKQEKREPYLAPEIWSLFPDRLDDEGKPEGWQIATVSDIGQVICGKTPSTSRREYYGGDVPFITIPDMHGKIFALHASKMLSKEGADSQPKQTLPAASICVSCIASPGLVVITSQISQTNQQINSVIPSAKDEIFYWYWTIKGLGELIRQGGSGGSVLSNLSTGRFKALAVLFASREARKQYHACTTPLFARILENDRESTLLASLRDLLLPKLMSGEIRVRDAEKIVVDAA